VSTHRFSLTVTWDGGTLSALDFRDKTRRRHTVSHEGKQSIEASAAPAFHGEKSRWNPEDLFLAALSQCHMLTFFYLANEAGVEVADYRDTPEATLETHQDGSGEMTQVVLRPVVTIRSGDEALVKELHHTAHSMCFIARSVSVPVTHEATTIIT
jgi:organic hydroperoxide reductase OsmC/OhrA